MNGSKTVVGIDIAKRVFQLHWIDMETGEIVSLQLKREKFLEHFANRQPCLIGMEACGGAQHWARKLTAMGHQVKLLPGKAGVRKGITDALARLADRLTAMVIDTLREQWVRIEKMDKEIATIEQRIKLWLKQDEACTRIAEIPGVGPLTATAAVAIMGNAKAFKSGREFAAFAGLVPRQTGTGGRIKLLGVSKRGDTYLRTLLIHGARSVLTTAKDPGPWANELRQRRPLNVAIVALANKMARTIWAILAHERTYQKEFVSQPA